MEAATPDTAATDPVTVEERGSNPDSNCFSRFYFDHPFGNEAEIIELRNVIDRVSDACNHEGCSELVGVYIAREYFDLKISSTDPLNTQFGLVEVMSSITFSDVSPDEDDEEDCEDEDASDGICFAQTGICFCNACNRAGERVRAAQDDTTAPVGQNAGTLTVRIKQMVASLFGH